MARRFAALAETWDAARCRGAGAGGRRMSTVRLTAAQAAGAPRRGAEDRGRRALHRRLLGHLRARKRGRHGRGAARPPRRPAHLARPQRAGHGPCRHRLRQAAAPPAGDDGHLLDRAGRHQHGHRRGAGARQPACPCCWCRATCSPAAGPDPVLQQVEDWGDGTVSANDCFRPVSRYFDRITRPEQLLTALPRAFATMTDSATCGPATLAFCQDVQAEAHDLARGLLRAARLAHPLSPPRRARGREGGRGDPRRAPARDRRGRRRALRPGGGAAAPLRRGARGARGRDAGGQVLAALGPSAQPRRRGRHRDAGRQRGLRRGRPGAQPWAPGCRTSPRAPGRCSAATRASSASTSRPTTRASTAPCRSWATLGAALAEIGAALGGWRGPGAEASRQGRLVRRRGPAHRPARGRQRAAHRPAGHRRGAARRGPRHGGDVRRGNHAGRAASPVEGWTAGLLPHGIRLLLHGLRDRGARWASPWPSRSAT